MMWRHWCPAERSLMAVGPGEECNWCGAREENVRFKVRLNKWDGKKFENDVACSLCGHQGHVVEFSRLGVVTLMCQSCLHDAVCAIYGAVRETIPKWRDPRKEGPHG